MNLKAYLATCEITRTDFAKWIGISRSAIDHYMTGLRCPNLEVSMKIVRKTKGKVTMEDLLDYYKEKNAERKKK